ncbi:MAG TPA: hypothetical protein VGQ02_10275 [Candidatus Limnocylindrales bacterium]|nr:hypothetical protein [Candidatus Limnocylindrales bacterium]
MTRSRRASAQRPLSPVAFVDRVMAAVRLEAPPTPARALATAVRRRSLSDAGSALAVAWHLATVRAWHVAPSVRARSMALVLAVALALISGSLAAAGAVRLAADPVTHLFQAPVDDRGLLGIPPAIVNVDPGGLDDQDAAEPAGEQEESGDDQGSGDHADRDDSDDPSEAGDDEQDRDDSAEEATVDDSADADDTVDEADEAEPDEPDVDAPEAGEPDADDGGDASDADGASGDSESGSDD